MSKDEDAVKPSKETMFTSIRGKTTSGDDASYNMTLMHENNTWQVGGDPQRKIFETRTGTYNQASIPVKGIELLSASGALVGFLRNLTESTPVNQTGDGNVEETGRTISWTTQ